MTALQWNAHTPRPGEPESSWWCHLEMAQLRIQRTANGLYRPLMALGTGLAVPAPKKDFSSFSEASDVLLKTYRAKLRTALEKAETIDSIAPGAPQDDNDGLREMMVENAHWCRDSPQEYVA